MEKKFNHPRECDECPVCGITPNNADMDCGYPKPICPNK